MEPTIYSYARGLKETLPEKIEAFMQWVKGSNGIGTLSGLVSGSLLSGLPSWFRSFSRPATCVAVATKPPSRAVGGFSSIPLALLAWLWPIAPRITPTPLLVVGACKPSSAPTPVVIEERTPAPIGTGSY